MPKKENKEGLNKDKMVLWKRHRRAFGKDSQYIKLEKIEQQNKKLIDYNPKYSMSNCEVTLVNT